jgi:hypothetical protein
MNTGKTIGNVLPALPPIVKFNANRTNTNIKSLRKYEQSRKKAIIL